MRSLYPGIDCSAIISDNLIAQSPPPNILLIITDDHGVDATNGYHQSNVLPQTPTFDSLRAQGITFENVFATPKCTPSRASIMSGKYGIKSGVVGVPANLDTTNISIFKALANQTNNQYKDAAIGKWHSSTLDQCTNGTLVFMDGTCSTTCTHS